MSSNAQTSTNTASPSSTGSGLASNSQVDEVGDPNSEIQLKLSWSLKNRLINKLNHQSKIMFHESLTVEQKIGLFEESNKLISSLNDLPILTETGTIDGAHDDIGSLQVIEVLSNDGSLLNPRSDAETPAPRSVGLNLQKVIKSEIEMLTETVGKFDPQKDVIATWLAKYDSYCEACEWSDQKRSDYLNYLLNYGLHRVIRKCENYDKKKKALIGFVERMLIKWDFSDSQHIRSMYEEMTDLDFTNIEIRYWLTCFLPANKLLEITFGVIGDKIKRLL